MHSKNKITVLNNNIKMPLLGFGTYMIEDYDTLNLCINSALDIGYRHIDTASYYNNEIEIGKILKESSIKRNDIFITTKLWNHDHGYEKTLKAFNTSLKKLNTNYIDLYLIHWPNPYHKETWRALEKLYKEGFVRAIGVCNYTIDYLKQIINNFDIVPAVNQIEFHPYLIQKDLMDFCKMYNIQIEAWSPLMRGKIFEIDLLKKMAQKYNRSISQIVLRWDIEMGVSTVPKSITPARIKENSKFFDFSLTPNDIKDINNLNLNKRFSQTPDNVFNNPGIFD